jgi:hypothetical protein
VTSPFQSIIGTPENAIEDQVERYDGNSSLAISIEPPFGSSEVFVGIETGICAAAKNAAGSTAPPQQQRNPLRGGVYTPADALKLLNSHFFIGKNDQETGIFRINDDGSITFVPPDQFKLDVANIFARPSGGSAKPIPVEKYWKESPKRHERKIVFKPGGTSEPDEFNLWQGFGLKPRKGWHKQRRLVQHVRQVICGRDKKKFKYLIRLLAWMVQNPDKHSGVVLVLKSRKQGTGKTTLGNVMLDIFGRHGARIDDKDRLLGRFNDWQETVCFALLEEATWAGDHRAADKLKSLITGDTLQIERKFGTCRQVPNRLKTIATTNHDHAVHAGVQDRRNVVYDVSDERVGDKAWFQLLYRDLAEGGTSEFLWFLKNLKLGGWHPARDILKTAETAEQQRMSGDSVSQWSQSCIDADAIIGASHGMSASHDLGNRVASEALREAYTGYCKQHGLRAVNVEAFGKACTDMFGPRKRLSALSVGPAAQTAEDVGASTEADEALCQRIKKLKCPRAEPGPTVPHERRRPWGYDVPDGGKWQEKVDGRLGIRN